MYFMKMVFKCKNTSLCRTAGEHNSEYSRHIRGVVGSNLDKV